MKINQVKTQEITIEDVKKRAKFFENINAINASLSTNLTFDERKYTIDKEIREEGVKHGISDNAIDLMLVEWHSVHSEGTLHP